MSFKSRSLSPGKFLVFSAALGGLVIPQAAVASAGDPQPRLTLERALELAFENSPALRARVAEVEQARGRLVGAGTYLYNPQLGVELGGRRAPAVRSTDASVVLSQEIEIAGQRGKRASVARAELAAAQSGLSRDRRLLAARVALDFAEAVRARDTLDVDQRDVSLARSFLDYTHRRFEAGAASQIELNLARATAGRAERRALSSGAAVQIARSVLAETIGTGATGGLEPAGEMPTPIDPLLSLAELLGSAVEHRADLAEFRAASLAAQDRIRLTRSEAWPNLSLAGFYAREEGTDTIFGGGLSISLPIFNRNQGAIAEAEATLTRATAETEALRLMVQREVAAAYASHEAARGAVARLREQVLGSLEENLGLLERSFTAGKIGATDLLIFRREFVESQREFIEASFDFWATRILLELAAGRTQLPDLGASAESKETQS